jgi:DNA-binding response OmpR family regulator
VEGDESLPAVLHVEDDAAVGNLVAAALDGLARVETVRTLAQARQRLDGRDWALVVLDSRLPDGAGLDLLPELRATLGPARPVILFTGEDSAAESAGSLAHVFLKGSCGPGEIRRVVGKILMGS